MKNNRYSNLKIFNFPAKMESFRAGIVTAPLYVRIKPINDCNHGCHWCSYKADRRDPYSDDAPKPIDSHMHETMKEHDRIPNDKMIEILEDLSSMGVKAVTYSGGGEPLFYVGATEMLQHTLDLGIDLSIITNGQLLNGQRAEVLRHAKWVRVSMDYTTQHQMEMSRRVSGRLFHGVMDNLRMFATAKDSTCDLGINFIVTRENCNDLDEFAHLMQGAGVNNVRFSPVYVPGFYEYHRHIAERVQEQLSEIGYLCSDTFTVNSTYDISSPSKAPVRPFTRCLYAQTVPVIGADLKVYACHNTAYTEHGCLGSIEHQSFKEMWFSEETRKRMVELNPSAVCNHECANHSKVELFNEIADSHVDNFV